MYFRGSDGGVFLTIKSWKKESKTVERRMRARREVLNLKLNGGRGVGEKLEEEGGRNRGWVKGFEKSVKTVKYGTVEANNGSFGGAPKRSQGEVKAGKVQ